LGALRFIALQTMQRLSKRVEPKISLPARSVHAIEKRRQIDEFVPRIQEKEVKHLLACHNSELSLLNRISTVIPGRLMALTR
jgi:metal-dependent hydrolase (beta-lactamase superfamily II)